jgi:hypothetical protein
MDKQQIELVGTAALTMALISEGFEIAHPIRDHGIDLIVFSDSPHQPFAALPIQVKIHTGAGLMIQRKYEKFEGLVYGVVWHAEQDPRFFLFDYPEAMTLLPEGCTNTECWTRPDGHWTWTAAPMNLQIKMKLFENRWDWLRAKLAGSHEPNAQSG